jgi:UDP-glucose 4-epimerase
VFYVYGPGEARERLLSSVLLRLAHGETVAVREPRRRLDYIYVGDVAHAFVTLALQSMTGAHDIGTGVPVTVRELVRKTAAVAGFDPACVVEDEIQSPGPDVIADPKSLQTAGWSAEIDLTGGIRSLWNTLRSGNQ